jgi:hypothetical protein
MDNKTENKSTRREEFLLDIYALCSRELVDFCTQLYIAPFFVAKIENDILKFKKYKKNI